MIKTSSHDTGLRHFRVKAILDHVVGERILDVGCTGGSHKADIPSELHIALNETHKLVIGIDIDEEHIDIMFENGYKNAMVADAQTFSFDEPFDTIVAGELIEHLSEPAKFLSNCWEHLNPSGRLILSTPYAFALIHVLYSLSHFPKTCSHYEHTCWFCPNTLQELVRRCGYKVVSWELTESYSKQGPTFSYRTLVGFFNLFRPLIPKRIRCNSMLFVLEKTTISQ